MTKETIEKICESGLEYLFLGSLISSDNNMSKEEIERNLKRFDELEKTVNESDIPEEKKEEFNRYIKKGRTILNDDLKILEQNG